VVDATKNLGVAALDDATLLSSAVELACDMDGRVQLESLVDRGSQAQIQTLVEKLQGNILLLTLNEHGCRIVQKVMQVVSCDMQAKLFGELSVGIVQCIEDKHGNFVVQACIEQLPPDAVRFVATAVEGRVKSTCCHNYGCRVVQRLIEHCPTEQVAQIMDQAVGAAPELAKSQYGCHVLRCVLERGRIEDKTRIFASMRVNLSKLARSRFSSLVIEKCLEAANAAEPTVAKELQGEVTALVQTILAEPSQSTGNAGEVPLAQMAATRFGRNILRKLLDSTAEPERSELQRKLSKVRPSWETNAQ
jgi:pumilio RNA-binding family